MEVMLISPEGLVGEVLMSVCEESGMLASCS